MYCLTIIRSLLLLASAAVTAQARPNGSYGNNIKEPAYPARCFPDPCANITFVDAGYVCGDKRLGPIVLPRRFPLSTELATYARFGSLCPFEFLEKWTFLSNGSFIYPGQNGFMLDTDGRPITGNTTLVVGRKVDRFGSEAGNFLGPLGAPYIERSLPPVNLDTFDHDFPYNYHVYEVIKELVVALGPIAPWFEQPGLGTQFVTSSSISELLDSGYLRRLSRKEYDEKADFADDYTPGPDSD